jgi:hypothetical protein
MGSTGVAAALGLVAGGALAAVAVWIDERRRRKR